MYSTSSIFTTVLHKSGILVGFGPMHSNEANFYVEGKHLFTSLTSNFDLILMLKLKVGKLIHLQDTNSLASVSAVLFLCLSALSSSARCTESKKNVHSTGLGLYVLKHGKQ